MPCPHCQGENPSGVEVCFECGQPLAAITKGSVIAERYEVRGVLGRGGMGVVYEAHDRLLDEAVAIKVLKRELLAEREAGLRFRNEIKLARRVSHPNVCRIHEYGEHGGLSYISMALVRGQDLRHRLAEFPAGLPTEEAYEVAIQAGRGLQAIHDAGVIHRDFKTPNIMLEADGAVRLMDFGIAKAGVEGAGRLTATGMVLGTPEFMSPEQCRGLPLDARSDIYALGIVIFELFTGRVPFQGDSLTATLMKQIGEAPPLAGPAAERLPPGVVPVLRKALAKAPGERYARASDVAMDLEEALAQSHRPVSGAQPGDPAAPTAALAMPAVGSGRAATPASLAAASLAREAHPERRAAPRLELPVDVSLKKLGPQGAVLAQERTLADNVSRTGLRVMTALDSIEPGDTVLIQEIAGDLQARAQVRNRLRGGDGIWRLGLELIDAVAPDRLVRTGEWTSKVATPPSSAPPAGRERRSSSRIKIPVELTLERLALDGQPAQQERTLAENIGRGGVQVLTAMPALAVGEVVSVAERGGDFRSRAAVRSTYVGPDHIRRVNLEFLDRQAPDRLVPVEGTPPPRLRETPAPQPAPAAGPGRTVATTATPTRPAAPALRRSELLELSAALKTRTHYEVLGLKLGADVAQVREAYSERVRRFHPDAVRASGVDDLQAELGAILGRLAEARRVLSDEQQRADYDRRLGLVPRLAPAPPPPPTATDPAPALPTPAPDPVGPLVAIEASGLSIEASLRQARELLKQEQNWDAIQLLEKALPQAGSTAQRHLVQVLLAQAVLKNPKWLRRGEDLLLEVTRENPQQVAALLMLARIYRQQHLRARAERLLHQVLQVDPGNSAAATELKVLAREPRS